MSEQQSLSCCITFDFDGMSSWIGSAKSNNPSMISRGQFGAVAIPRILDLLDRYQIRSSFAVPGHTAYAYPRLVAEIHDRGHELVHHGWVHENPADFDEAGERNLLEKGLEALHRVAGVRPKGYRSPAWDFSERTVELLIEYGFSYDSSCMGHDFYPYYLRRGDQWSTTTAYQFGEVTELIELPVTWGLDDFPVSECVIGLNEGLRAPSAVEEMWRDDFDYARANYADGLFTLTLHPQTIGRGNRMLMLERLIKHFAENDAKFETMGDYYDRWRQANPVSLWLEQNPDLSGELAINP
jgi:peptidoglycan/xylan/chitin deacetylase (PgdA/CDA1 family)